VGGVREEGSRGKERERMVRIGGNRRNRIDLAGHVVQGFGMLLRGITSYLTYRGH
jgi:hypothetical protein